MLKVAISGEKIFEIFGFPITNTFALSLIISFLMIIFFLVFFKKIFLPNKTQNFFEWILETLLNFTDSLTGSRENTKEIFPLSATIFIFILLSNRIELIPGIGIFHFLRSPSSDLNFTLALAIFSIFYVNFLVLRKLGILKYLKRFFHKNPLFSFVGLLEAISELIRTLSLALRLFGNLFAGEILLTVTSFLFPFIFPLPFLFLEILVGFVQAFIFASLVVIFYTIAIQTAYHG